VQRELFLDFRQVAVLHQPVGLRILRALDKQVGLLDLAAGAAHAAEGIDDDVLARHQAGAQHRHQRHEDARRIAARRGDEREFPPVAGGQFGQDEARPGQQFRRMVLAVIPHIGGEIGDAEVGAEVDDLLAGGDERPGVGGRGAVRQRQEEQGEVARGERRGVGVDKPQAAVEPAHRGDHLRQRLARMLARGHRGQRDVRMAEQEFDESFAGITGRTDNADFHGRRRI